ncbi:MAG TPA: hypothetical protein VFG47_19080, partial [Geminicoccaceae bacterium]|nr:hypothetical protein [Geminicoccaceae bacterium]
PALDALIARAADLVEAHVDLERLRRLARPFGLGLHGPPPRPLRPLGRRIAVAADAAFAFAYPAVLDGWRRAGAGIAPFSPLADEPPAPDADAVYLPGGYPELHAGRLAANSTFLEGLRASAARGAFVYGECGGFMVLGEALVDAEGGRHVMAGLLPVVASMAAPRLHLGYRGLRLLEPCPLGPAGAGFRGHEFHYAALAASGDGAAPLFDARDSRGRELGPVGARVGTVAGSFAHLVDGTAAPARNRGGPGHLRLVP